MYSRSRISLGFSAVARVTKDGSPPIKQVRLRDFEAPMSGAFYLVERFDELAEFFEPGKEIVFFENEEDLVDESRFYLRNARERRRIRDAGLRRAREEHTWQRRFESAFRAMGLGAHSLSPVLRGEGRSGHFPQTNKSAPHPNPLPRVQRRGDGEAEAARCAA
jgi:hypothetical protein